MSTIQSTETRENFPPSAAQPSLADRVTSDSTGLSGAELVALFEIARAVAADAADHTDPEICLRHLRSGLIRLGFERVGIWITDVHDPSVIRGTWGTNWDGSERDEHGITLPIGSDVDSQRIIAGERVVLRHVSTPAAIAAPPHLLPEPGDGPPNHACVALRADGELLGLVGADMLPTSKTIDAGRVAALELVADVVATAIARGRVVAEVRESEARYRTITELTSDYTYAAFLPDDGTMRVEWITEAVTRITGYTRDEAMQSNRLLEIAHPDDRPLVQRGQEAIRRGETTEIEYRIITRDDQVKWLRVRSQPERDPAQGKVVRVYAAARDVTEWKRMGLELRQAQKLEAVGRLAAGIAHEINTPIQFVGDNTRFLQDSLAQIFRVVESYRALRATVEEGATVDPILLETVRAAEEDADLEYLEAEIPKALNETLDGVQRVATIVRSLKEFAHPDSREQSPADLNQALLGTLTVARNELKYVADVVTDLAPLPPVCCYVGELNQVFLNLLINAAHAIADAKLSGKGEIRVRTAQEGDRVIVQIGDNGCGVPEAIRQKVFDPFFTTKEVGRGTGQGLALARSVVVDKHHGALTFDSQVGVGTTFTISLPISGWAGNPRKG